MKQPGYRTSQRAILNAFGRDHITSIPALGTPSSLAGITRASVIRRHAEMLNPRRSILLVVGDLTGLGAEAAADRLWGDLQAEADTPAAVGAPIIARPGQFGVHEAFADQVTLVGLAAQAGKLDPAVASVVNHIIGGGFSSRLNNVLREQKGWTYGISSTFASRRERFEFHVSSQLQADRAGEALELVRSILARTARTQDITTREMEAARESIMLSLAARFATNAAVLTSLIHRAEADLPDDDIPFADRLEALTLDEVQTGAQVLADPDRLTWVVGFDPAGPAAASLARLDLDDL